MHFIHKLGLLCFCFAVVKSEEKLECNLKYCGSELMNFDGFSFSDLFRKLELASFCVKNCTPAVVHEFFQSIIFGISKRIPGHCSGDDCVDKNRFVALAKCAKEEAWDLLQCSKKLIDLAHIGLLQNPEEIKKNTTCKIVTEAVQCIEETLQRCGEQPFELVKKIAGDFIHAGITTYCHPAYNKQGWLMKRTTGSALKPSGATALPSVSPDPGFKPPQYVKGYRADGGASGLQSLSYFSLLISATFTFMLSLRHFH